MNFYDLHIEKPFETTSTEFKERLNRKMPFAFLKTLCAFSNTSGGTIYIGVNDKTRELDGMSIHEAEEEVDFLQSQAIAHLDPMIALTYAYVDYQEDKSSDRKWILAINVKEAKSKPIFLRWEKTSTVFIRKEGKSIPATTDEIRAMLIASVSASYDSLFTNQKFSPQDFTLLYRTYQEENEGGKLEMSKLMANGFMNEQGYLSRGALLFRDDADEANTEIHLRCWKGESKGDDILLDNKEEKGNLIHLRKEMIDFIRRNSATGLKKTATSAIARDAYPAMAIREAVTNALAHRNYFMQGTEIGVDIFIDRLEILSPGSVYAGREIHDSKDLLSVFPWRRNQVISNIFTLLHYMEKSRSGFEKILEAYRKEPEEKKPLINADAYSFKITLFDTLYTPKEDLLSSMKHSVALRKILAFCQEAKSLPEISAYIGLKPSQYFRKNYLRPLLDLRLLRMTKKPNSPDNKYLTVTAKDQ